MSPKLFNDLALTAYSCARGGFWRRGFDGVVEPGCQSS